MNAATERSALPPDLARLLAEKDAEIAALREVIRAARAEALREAAKIALAHKGSAAKKRLARGYRLGSLPAHAQDEIVAEERGEDIAAEIIHAAITALIEKEKPDAP